jgi:hypothetical protein
MSGAAGNPSNLPSVRDVAEWLRSGELEFNDVCAEYGVSASTLASRLSAAGYDLTGHPRRIVNSGAPEPLTQGDAPVYIAGGVGGGDYLGLPLSPVPHIRRRREFIGLDWSTSPATGPLWRYV